MEASNAMPELHHRPPQDDPDDTDGLDLYGGVHLPTGPDQVEGNPNGAQEPAPTPQQVEMAARSRKCMIDMVENLSKPFWPRRPPASVNLPSPYKQGGYAPSTDITHRVDKQPVPEPPKAGKPLPVFASKAKQQQPQDGNYKEADVLLDLKTTPVKHSPMKKVVAKRAATGDAEKVETETESTDNKSKKLSSITTGHLAPHSMAPHSVAKYVKIPPVDHSQEFDESGQALHSSSSAHGLPHHGGKDSPPVYQFPARASLTKRQVDGEDKDDLSGFLHSSLSAHGLQNIDGDVEPSETQDISLLIAGPEVPPAKKQKITPRAPRREVKTHAEHEHDGHPHGVTSTGYGLANAHHFDYRIPTVHASPSGSSDVDRPPSPLLTIGNPEDKEKLAGTGTLSPALGLPRSAGYLPGLESPDEIPAETLSPSPLLTIGKPEDKDKALDGTVSPALGLPSSKGRLPEAGRSNEEFIPMPGPNVHKQDSSVDTHEEHGHDGHPNNSSSYAHGPTAAHDDESSHDLIPKQGHEAAVKTTTGETPSKAGLSLSHQELGLKKSNSRTALSTSQELGVQKSSSKAGLSPSKELPKSNSKTGLSPSEELAPHKSTSKTGLNSSRELIAAKDSKNDATADSSQAPAASPALVLPGDGTPLTDEIKPASPALDLPPMSTAEAPDSGEIKPPSPALELTGPLAVDTMATPSNEPKPASPALNLPQAPETVVDPSAGPAPDTRPA
ncbi:hypothetical protein BV898_08257 [Hypsibius exemplaris]|uniref:Uncharacterized protein n=1 Tax=Hypsibius exemplaris TaxID=2072580 RepID=A0A1W0WR58_HYPEX|nr:hypothetical protein BV898_08257 [Hypsibius exemplaris]